MFEKKSSFSFILISAAVMALAAITVQASWGGSFFLSQAPADQAVSTTVDPLAPLSTIIVPAGNTNGGSDRHPLGVFFGFERSAAIYLGSELGFTGGETINQACWYVQAAPVNTANVPTKIYMKSISNGNFAATSTVAAEETGATLVFNATIPAASFVVGNFTCTTLSPGFSFAGPNLEIIVETNFTGAGTGGSTDRTLRTSATVPATRHQVWNQDTTAPTGVGSLTSVPQRPNIQLDYSPSVAPGTLQFSAAAYSGNEGTSATITVNRVAGASGAVSVDYATGGGSANAGAACTAGVDYVSASGTLNWADGDNAAKTFNVALCSDGALFDPAETVSLTLSNVVGTTITGTNPATLTITDVPLPLSGSYTVGSGGTYPSLTNSGGIFEAINLAGASGNLTIDIVSDLTSETGVNALNEIAGGFTVLMKPSGAARIVSGTSTGGGLIKLNGADSVTIDGSLSGGTDRSLTITDGNLGGTVLWIASASASNGANNDTVKNCIISGNTGTIPISGILTGSGTTLGGDAETANNNITIQNNAIFRVQNSIYLRGNAAGTDTGASVVGNTLGSSVAADKNQFRGMLIGNSTGFLISGNTVSGVASTVGSTSKMVGIQTALVLNGGTIEKNKVSDIKHTSTSTFGATGIDLAGGNNIVVKNNFVSDINHNMSGGAAFSTTFGVFGIQVEAGTGNKIYNNSVNLFGLQAGTAATNLLTAAFAINATTSTGTDVRDNIFANNITGGTTGIAHVAVYLPTGGTSAMNLTDNNNSYYFGVAPAGGAGETGTTAGSPNRATLALLAAYTSTLHAAATNDNASIASTGAVPFATANDLHITIAAPEFNTGVVIAGITDDIDGDSRPQNAGPEIGADELAGGTPTSTATASPTATNTATPTSTSTPTSTATSTPTPGCGSGTFSYTGPAVNITDNAAAGVNFSIPVSGVGSVADVNFRFDGIQSADFASTTPGVNHSWVGDLKVKITAPGVGAPTVLVYDQPRFPATSFGCSNNNLAQILLDDEGGFPTTEDVCVGTGQGDGDAAYPIGTYSPNNALSAFDGFNPNGVWTVNISDNAAGDTGAARAFSLIIDGGCGTATPTATSTSTPTATATGTPSPTNTATPTATATCTPSNIILDGGFETGGIPSTIWNNPQTSTNFGTPLCDNGSCGTGGGASPPRTGLIWAWFGGATSPETATLGQSVVIPSGTASLHFWMRIGTVTAPFNDVLNVRVDGAIVQSYPEPATAELAYTERVIDMTAFANGASHNVTFEYIGPGTDTGSYVIDDVSLQTGTGCTTPTSTPTSTATATNTPTNTPTPTAGTIAGTIAYGNAIPAGFRAVSNATVASTAGSPSVSTVTAGPGGTAGQYLLTGFGAGAYTIAPNKSTGVNGITSFDAGKVAQHAAGIALLTGNALVVADVSANNSITSFDAGQIAKFVVSDPPFGQTGTWRFYTIPSVPFPPGATATSRTYPSVTTNITGEDYTGLLMGEVSGNWTNTGARPAIGPERSAVVSAGRIVTPADYEVIIPVSVEGAADKGIIAYEFNLRYDPSVIQPQANPVDLAGTVSSKLSVVTNADEAGLLKVAVYGALPLDNNGLLMNLRFTAVGAPGSVSPLTWEKVMFNEGDPATMASDGMVELSAAAPNQAEINGRLLTAMGQGVSNARVTLTDSTGQTRTVLSNGFGVYRFGNLQVGQTYTISVESRNFAFTPLMVSVAGQASSVDVIAEQ